MIRNVSVAQKKISLNTDQGSFSRQFRDPILKYLIYGNRILVVLNYMDYSKTLENQNVYCLDERADIVWQIQDPFVKSNANKKKHRDGYVDVYIKEGNKLGATTFGGYAYTLNADTGQVSQAKFVK